MMGTNNTCILINTLLGIYRACKVHGQFHMVSKDKGLFYINCRIITVLSGLLFILAGLIFTFGQFVEDHREKANLITVKDIIFADTLFCEFFDFQVIS